MIQIKNLTINNFNATQMMLINCADLTLVPGENTDLDEINHINQIVTEQIANIKSKCCTPMLLLKIYQSP